MPALDAVWFARLAHQIDAEGLGAVIDGSRERPLFPIWAWLVHEATETAAGSTGLNWALCVQLAAGIAMTLSVVPVYYISLRLVGHEAAICGALLFCVLPAVCRLGADGISDSTHLLLFSLAAWAAVEYLIRLDASGANRSTLASSALLAAAGLASAAAYFTRSEALVLPAALFVLLGAFQLNRTRRRPWLPLLADFACFATGFAAVYGPVQVAASLSDPGAAASRHERREMEEPSGAPAWVLSDGSPMVFDRKEPTVSIRRTGYVSAAGQLAEEAANLFGFWVGPLALFGLWQLRGRPPSAADRFFQVFVVLFALVALDHTAREGYLSARHLVVWVVPGMGCAGFGVLAFARLLSSALGRRVGDRYAAAWASAGILLLAVSGCALQLAEPLHSSRVGHRLAAEWLSAQAASPGAVFDTHGWTGIYTARRVYASDQLSGALLDAQLAYLVVEQEELQFDSGRSRTLRTLIAAAAKPVARFPDRKNRAHAVVVYRWDAEQFRTWRSGGSERNSVDRMATQSDTIRDNPSNPALGSSRAAFHGPPHRRRG